MAKRKRYPKCWKSIREQILERAGGCCEGSPRYPLCRAKQGEPHPVTGTLVVLQVAHYPDPEPSNVSPKNLVAQCPRCHLATDEWMHQRNRKRERTKAPEGQLPLFEGYEKRRQP